MDTVTLREQGDGLSLTLPSGIRQRLGYKAGDTLTLVEVEDGLKLVRQPSKLDRQMELAQKVLRDHAGVLQALASR